VKKLPSGQWQITPTTTMNKKRKILTLLALVAFGVIIALHYYHPLYNQWTYPEQHHSGRTVTTSKLVWGWSNGSPLIEDIRMPVFVLAVFYAGLFFLFGGKDTDSVPRRPRDWQRIKQVILNISVFAGGLMVIAGIIGAAIESNEYQQQQERARKAYIEDEASKHRIKSSEIGLKDLKLDGVPYGPVGEYNVTGRVTNGSKYPLTALVLKITLTDNYPDGNLEIIGEERVTFNVTVPPYQTRNIQQYVWFRNFPKPAGKYQFSYFVAETRGNEGHDWQDDPIVKDFDPDKYLGLTPTPSPKRDIFDRLAEEEEAKKKRGTAKPSDIIETVDPKTGKRKKIDLSGLPDKSPTP